MKGWFVISHCVLLCWTLSILHVQTGITQGNMKGNITTCSLQSINSTQDRMNTAGVPSTHGNSGFAWNTGTQPMNWTLVTAEGISSLTQTCVPQVSALCGGWLIVRVTDLMMEWSPQGGLSSQKMTARWRSSPGDSRELWLAALWGS